MKKMALWTAIGGACGFLLFFALFSLIVHHHPENRGEVVVFSLLGVLPASALGALFAAVNIFQQEMHETRRQLNHWMSIQELDIELDKPSTHIKPTPPSGRG